MNIIDAVLFQARHNPAHPALIAPGTKIGLVSYGKLARFIAAIGGAARRHGLTGQDVVAVDVADPIFHAALVLGLTHMGVVTLSARSRTFPTEIGVTAVIAERQAVYPGAGRVIVADLAWLSDADHDAPRGNDAVSGATDPCRIILTSGTTGEARGILFSHGMVLDRVLRQNMMLGGIMPNCSRAFLDFGPSTSLGFLTLVAMLTRGGTVLFRGADAADTMQAFGLYDIQCMFAAPSGLAEFVEYYEQSPAFQSRFQAIVTAGSLLARSLSDRVRARLCPNLVSVFGSTETSIVATAPAHAIASIEGAVGFVAPGIIVQTVDGSDRLLAPDQEGRIRIRGDIVAPGYIGAPAAHEKTFHDGWFYPGDLGFVSPDNLLIISGREKTIINLGGDKVSPENIENMLAACPGVAEVAVFGRLSANGIEEICALVVAKAGLDDDTLRAHCRARVPVEHIPHLFIRVDAIPRNAMGKVDRPRLAGIVAPAGGPERQ